MLKMIRLAGFALMFFGAAGLVVQSSAIAQAPVPQFGRKAPLERAVPIVPQTPGNASNLQTQTISCPTGDAYFRVGQTPESFPVQFGNGWIAATTKAVFFKAEIGRSPAGDQQRLLCIFRLDVDGRITTNIYRDAPKGSCRLGADQKSFVCRM